MKTIEEQNAVLNRFQEQCREFGFRENLSQGELLQIVLTEALHRLGHAGTSKQDFERLLLMFKHGAHAARATHERDCLGEEVRH